LRVGVRRVSVCESGIRVSIGSSAIISCVIYQGAGRAGRGSGAGEPHCGAAGKRPATRLAERFVFRKIIIGRDFEAKFYRSNRSNGRTSPPDPVQND
jgi:hypothetical protein